MLILYVKHGVNASVDCLTQTLEHIVCTCLVFNGLICKAQLLLRFINFIVKTMSSSNDVLIIYK